MGKYYWKWIYCDIFILAKYLQRQIRVEEVVDYPSYTTVLYELTILLA